MITTPDMNTSQLLHHSGPDGSNQHLQVKKRGPDVLHYHGPCSIMPLQQPVVQHPALGAPQCIRDRTTEPRSQNGIATQQGQGSKAYLRWSNKLQHENMNASMHVQTIHAWSIMHAKKKSVRTMRQDSQPHGQEGAKPAPMASTSQLIFVYLQPYQHRKQISLMSATVKMWSAGLHAAWHAVIYIFSSL